ncbi:MAG: hypothetical protein IPP08_01020 [Chlorobiota bacterium]|nr:hypothetical protein [Chlorobiota bacterium]QQS66790.1 MAG: hypothetical protein IPP08_01020 [Chlorobiota bacterium]
MMFKFLIPIIILTICFQNGCKENTNLNKKIEVSKSEKSASGLEIGEDSPSFMPFHVWGPDKGSRTCPICKYGLIQGLVYFIGNNPNWVDIKKWLTFLDYQNKIRTGYFKVYFVYGNDHNFSEQNRTNELVKLAKDLKIEYIDITYVPSLNDEESYVNLNRINPEVQNTFISFLDRTIIYKHINFVANETNNRIMEEELNNSKIKFSQIISVNK